MEWCKATRFGYTADSEFYPFSWPLSSFFYIRFFGNFYFPLIYSKAIDARTPIHLTDIKKSYFDHEYLCLSHFAQIIISFINGLAAVIMHRMCVGGWFRFFLLSLFSGQQSNIEIDMSTKSKHLHVKLALTTLYIVGCYNLHLAS